MTNQICDFHLHTSFSTDSKGDVIETIEKCISLGMTNMAITDHQDFGYPGDDFKLINRIEEYITTLTKLKEIYKDKIKLSIGCEVGLEADKPDLIESYVNSHDFDYIIGSSHLVNGVDIYLSEYYENRPIHEAFEEYFQSVLDNLDTCKSFDVYGHVDYIVRYSPNKAGDFSMELYGSYIDKLLTKIIAMGKGIEINTGGYRAGLGQPNPSFDIIKRYKELGGKIITFGSDAHKPEDVATFFEEALAVAKNAGFDGYYVFEKRKPRKIMF